MKLKVKKVRENATLPTRGTKEAAGIDLYACIDEPIVIPTGGYSTIPTGIACDFPDGYYGQIAVRSSIGFKKHLGLMNQIGVIDNDYNGEITVGLRNFGSLPQTIEPGDRIAQMVLLPYLICDIVETDTLEETERGEGGFGSTGR